MDLNEKAIVRIEHWIHHNVDHMHAYETFACELEACGKIKSAGCIRQMVGLVTRSNELLQRAMTFLEEEH